MSLISTKCNGENWWMTWQEIENDLYPIRCMQLKAYGATWIYNLAKQQVSKCLMWNMLVLIWVNWHRNKKFVSVIISEETNNTQLRTVCLIWHNQWRLRTSVCVYPRDKKQKEENINAEVIWPTTVQRKGLLQLFLYRIQSMELAGSNYSTNSE